MNKIRVYEYAKQINMSSKELINVLKKVDVEVANHMSTLENDQISKVENHLKNLRNQADAPARSQTSNNNHSASMTVPRARLLGLAFNSCTSATSRIISSNSSNPSCLSAET